MIIQENVMKEIFDFLVANPDYIISVFVLIFTVAGMQFKDMKFILISQIAANGLLAAQCIVGGTLSTGGVVILATVQTIICFILNRQNVKVPTWLTVLFMVGYSGIAVMGFFVPSIPSSPFDLITMVAAWFFALCVVQEKSWICRILSVANVALWLVYDIAVLPSAVINHIIIISTTIVGIIRNDRAEWRALLAKIFGRAAK